ncbi:AAA domain-containing protein [Streptomyces sp. NPDC059396]|uniref:serine/threonine-protein kinase n=1 Tax=Streptomyces sp. NPDC059396 TaxID=3346819 RepID=UPI00369A5B24
MRIVAERYVVMPDVERSGGQSTVVRATDAKTGESVALKLILRLNADATQREFFRREVTALSRLTHPNIVSLVDYGEDENEDAFFLVFRWFDKNLIDVLPPPDEFGWDDFIDHWGMPLVDALAHAHERGVVHRDVKPSNVLVGDDLTPKLADFAISKLRSQISPDVTVAEFFSRPFAPPDLTGLNSASRDVWGFAVTAVRCLSASTLADYPDLIEAFGDLDVPRNVLSLLRRCTDQNPDVRPPNAIVLRAELREIQDRRRRKWVQPQAAQLVFNEGVRLVNPPLDRDPDVVERALTQEFAGGSHLARFVDPGTGEPLADTLDLVGGVHRLRLVVLPGEPTFKVSRVHKVESSSLEMFRRRGWRVVDDVRWTSRRQQVALARRAMEMILAAVDEHYLRQDDEQQLRDENRMFDKWNDLLNAKEDLEYGRSVPVQYSSADVQGRRVRFHLAHALEADILGEERYCRTGSGATVGASGVVVEQHDRSVTLAYSTKVKTPPLRGTLVLDIGAARASLLRQREAVVSVRSGVSVNPSLRRLLVTPMDVSAPVRSPTPAWFNPALDEGKRAAVARALNSREFFLLEGPPGTGKTSFITELVRQELARNPDTRILLVSQTHVAVDNALVRLAEAGLANLVRLGKPNDERVAVTARQHLLDSQMPAWVAQIRRRAQRHLEELARESSVELKHVQGAASIAELQAAFTDLDKAQSRLDAVVSPSFGTTPHTPADSGEEEASRIAALNGEFQRLSERIETLRGQANALLDGDLVLPEDSTVADARAAFEAIVGTDQKLKDLVGLLRLQAEWLQRIESSRDLEAVLLRRARVVAGTCIGFLSHPAVRDIEFDLCILDEASKATATETLVPLSRSRRWVLVGDPSQLPPMQEEVLDDPKLTKRHSLERADIEQTLFQHLLDHAPETAKLKLTDQYRMHPGIGDMVSACFYNNELRTRTTRPLPGWDTLYKPVTWLDTSSFQKRRESKSGTSMVNPLEVRIIKDALANLRRAVERRLVRPEDDGPIKVLVLTAYRKQMEELRRALAGPASPLMEIEVNTVDAVQGREADVTFYSVVRSNDHGALGFLGELHWRRINVAFSRSRYGLVIVGDAPFCQARPGPLGRVLEYMRSHADTCKIGPAAHD